jgi:TonB-linked SusC/RagA family outer membrane protein
MQLSIIQLKKGWVWLLFCLYCTISNLHAQDRTVNASLKVTNATLPEILKKIDDQTSYAVAYSKDISQLEKTVTLDISNKSIAEIMATLQAHFPIDFNLTNGVISVKKKPEEKPSDKPIRGKVTNELGEPMVGVNIVLKGTTIGTISDANGEYSIAGAPNDGILTFSFIGMLPEEVAIGSRSEVSVVMKEDAALMDEVVVTALNLTREQKSLGYSVTKVEGEDLTRSVSGNWLTNMSGKVAGLIYAQAGTGPSGSIRVTLRGDRSLNYGKNEALFVVDGVPISSGMTATRSVSNYAQEDAPVDFGNGASDINPEDIASITVLKGPAAAALYGSRAANGAIIITTKSGKKTKGIGVTINSSVTFEKAGYFPDFQKEYGNGIDLGLNEYSLWEITPGMASDGVAQPRSYSRYTFGEKFDANKTRYLYASKDWNTDTYTKLPWVYQDDWYTGLFQTGVTTNNTITIDGNNGQGTSTRFSVTNYNNDWILPNTGFKKQTVSLTVNTPVTDKIKLAAKLNYYHKQSDNMPSGGYDESSPMYSLVWGFNVNSINDWKNEYFSGRYNYANWSAGGADGKGLVYPSTAGYNPYRTLYEALSSEDRDRVFGNISVTADLVKNLSFMLRSGLDWSNNFRTQRRPFYTTDYTNGFYREQTIREMENNNDFMLRYQNNDLANRQLGLSVMVGGNNRVYENFNSKITLSQLGEEGIYHTTNLPTGINPDPYNYRTKKVVNSFYGMASLSWNDTYYLDITGRNDWSSTLAPSNWSYFYPSVAASILLDEVLDLHTRTSWVHMLKLRASWANVGNDTEAYSRDQYYNATSYPGGYTLPGVIPDPLIKPEKTASWEVGLEGKLFHRASFDLALYSASTKNQIVPVAIDQATGATSMRINAGEITNKGVEAAITLIPVKTKDFTWSFDVNWARNINKLVKLQDGWDPTQPLQTDNGTTIGSRTFVYSYVGEEMHVLYGRGFKRAPEGASYLDENGNKVDASGMHIVNADGYPVLDESPDRRIGKVNPNWRAGMVQRLQYKNFSLAATFSAQYGGHSYSVTNFSLSYQGKLTNSLAGRNDGLVHKGVNAVTHDDGSVTYTKNTTVTGNIQTYYSSYMWTRDNTEMNTFSTDFIKLRELRLDYQIPSKILAKTHFLQKASVGMYATNVFCITDFPQFDPETGLLNGSDIYSGIESMAFPMTRTYGFNVQVSF